MKVRNLSGPTGWPHVQAIFITDRDAWAYVLTQFCLDTQKLRNLLDGFSVLQAGFLHNVGVPLADTGQACYLSRTRIHAFLLGM